MILKCSELLYEGRVKLLLGLWDRNREEKVYMWSRVLKKGFHEMKHRISMFYELFSAGLIAEAVGML